MGYVSSQSLAIIANDSTEQNLFVIENPIGSRVDVYIKDLDYEVDAVGVLTAVSPLIKVSRATNVSGGVILPKTSFNTTESVDSFVRCRAQNNEAARITATAGDTIWQVFRNRTHTAVEQLTTNVNDLSHSILPTLIENENFVLRPGQALLVKLVAAATTSNSALSYFTTVQCTFNEVAFSTFAISGTVTLSGSPVSGARVIVIEADDILMTNAILREVITTPAGGTWASTIKTGKVGAAFVQYESGGTYYTAYGSPYLQ